MINSFDPLADLIRELPVQCSIAVVLLFCAWLVAWKLQKHRLTALQIKLDELHHNVRKLEADYGSLLARFLNLRSLSSLQAVTVDQKNASIVPEKSEDGLREEAAH